MKRDLRPRATLARRFVDYYINKIAQASKPLAKMKVIFVLVTGSFLAHFFVVYGEYVLADPVKKDLTALEPEKVMKVSRNAKHMTKEDFEALKALAQLPKILDEAEKKLKEEEKKLAEEEKKPEEKKPEPKVEEKKPEEKKPEPEKKLENKSLAEKAKDDKDVERKVLLTEEQKKQAQKDAKKVGANNDNKVGVVEKPKDEKLAIQGVEKSADKVDKAPEPEKAAKKPEELKEPKADPNFQAKTKLEPPKAPTPPKDLHIANIDGKKEAKDPAFDPDKYVAKVMNEGKNKDPVDGVKGPKKPKDAPKPEPKPIPKKPVAPPPPPPPAPPAPKQPTQDEIDQDTLRKLKASIDPEPPAPAPAPAPAPPSGDMGDNGTPPPAPPKPLPTPPPPAPAPPPPPAPKPAPPQPNTNNKSFIGLGNSQPAPPAPPAPKPAPPAPPAVKPAPPAPPAPPRPPEAQPQVAQLKPPMVPVPNAKPGAKPGKPGPVTPNKTNVGGNGAAAVGDPRNRGTNGTSPDKLLARNDSSLAKRAQNTVSHDTDITKRDQVVDKNLREMDDWIIYELEGGRSPKDAMPGIYITNSNEDEWKDVISHFDLCPIAYPNTKDYFVLIDVMRQTLQKGYGKEAFDGLNARYASSGISLSKRMIWSTPVFSGAAELACNQYSIKKSDINLMILAPKQVMSYMAWKALKTVKDQGYDPAKVRACHARFSRTQDGWILKVTDVVLEDGSVRQVRT